MKAIHERPPTPQQIEEARRAYLAAIDPLIKYKSNLLSLGRPQMTLRDGQIADSTVVFSPEVQALIDNVDEHIKAIGNGFTVNGQPLFAAIPESK